MGKDLGFGLLGHKLNSKKDNTSRGRGTGWAGWAFAHPVFSKSTFRWAFAHPVFSTFRGPWEILPRRPTTKKGFGNITLNTVMN